MTAPRVGSRATVPFVLGVAGGGLLLASCGIHLDLYLTGYRDIPTIGSLFLLQVIVAFVLGAAAVVTAGTESPGRLGAAAAAAFALSTLGGYFLSLWVGLFGFHEVATTAGEAAAAAELLCFALLLPVAAGGRMPPARWGGMAAVVLPVVLIAAMLGGSVAAAGTAGRVGTAPPLQAGIPSVSVTIKNFEFHPDHVRATPGELIRVTNRDSVVHTFTSQPQDPVHFSTGTIAPGQTVSVRAPGKSGHYGAFPFLCTIHPFMTGVLIVEAKGG
ncbi:MAG: cupredoxin domain-containing protein [Acidimicrobiales bacterium]